MNTKKRRTGKAIRSGSIKVEPEILESVKVFCKQRGIMISHFANEALKEKLQKEK